MSKIKWVVDDRQYMSGSRCYLGKWEVGASHYDGCRSKDDPKKYLASCMLPGIKSNLDSYETEEEAKARVERAVNHWLNNIEYNP